MLSITKEGTNTQDRNKAISEIRGLSTDNKPTDVANGSTFIEIDTGKIYFYDAENEQWKEF